MSVTASVPQGLDTGLAREVGSVEVPKGTAQAAPAIHPLEPLSPQEIERAVALLRRHPQFTPGLRFSCVQLHEPDKDLVRGFQPGRPWNREAFATLLGGAQTYEAVVSLSENAVTSWTHIPGVQSAVLVEEFFECEALVKADPQFIDACAKRGVTDMSLVMVDPWSAGAYDNDPEAEGVPADIRLLRAMAWVRSEPSDNGYAPAS